MNDPEITALAREYAEEKGREMEQKQSLPSSLIKEVMEMDAEELTCFLKWLLRRFCLVEKEKVKQMYNTAMEVSRLPKSVDARGYAISRLQTLESLFPDLGKEVEG